MTRTGEDSVLVAAHGHETNVTSSPSTSRNYYRKQRARSRASELHHYGHPVISVEDFSIGRRHSNSIDQWGGVNFLVKGH